MHRKARILLSLGKAKVYKSAPFTIQLMYATDEAKQDTAGEKGIIEFSDVKDLLASRKDYRTEAGEAVNSVQLATIYELDTKRKTATTKH